MAAKKPKRKPHSSTVSRDTSEMVVLTGNPVWRALSKKPVNEETQTTIGLAGRKALYALSNGQGQFEHFNELVVTGYSAIVLAERGYGADLLAEFNSAMETILTCRLRALQGDAYHLSALEAESVSVLLDLHEQQVQLAEKCEVAAAVVEGYRRAS